MAKRKRESHQRSQGLLGVAPSMKEGCARRIRNIVAELDDLPFRALANSQTRGIMRDLQDQSAGKSPREADDHAAILQAVVSRARNRRRIPSHPR